MSILKEWITSICVTVIFITAVELILPDNSMKKYSRFVLGLILMTVIINPIIKIFTGSNVDMKNYLNSYESVLEEKSLSKEEYKEKNIATTLKNFENNISKSCEKLLNDKYPKDTFKVEVKGGYKKENFYIESINIGLGKNSSIKPVKKIHIDASTTLDKEKEEYGEREKGIISYVSNSLNINEKNITVYKIEGK
ncbi:stage III sporulation protein AF [Clostridium hydrogeniformans]|uniref:stage III sporulation protein AF n=1 Tax=Clostridium hydrogeniformans TaxID=349933 RepID=UPI0004849B16|nr:stage III sporulation protein AF [Clostridium hydrogeniformans]